MSRDLNPQQDVRENLRGAQGREWEPWEKSTREAFANALSATMDYLRGTYEDAIKENAALRKRVAYLEQRLEEELQRGRS